MKFDTVIIGGGLSGLVCGLRLLESGQKCAIVSSGQNAMHFFSGGFGLLSRMPDGTRVEQPLEAVSRLPETHPYAKIGAEKLSEYAAMTLDIFSKCGISVKGDATKNGYMISATGTLKPVWLALEEMTYLKSKDDTIGSKALIVNINGFLDFNTSFIAEALEKRGTACRIESVGIPETETLRKNASEMRSSNIAKLMAEKKTRERFMAKVKEHIKDEDTLILPAVFGLKSSEDAAEVRNIAGIRTYFIGTLTPSVPGIRTQMKMKSAFEAAGGVFLMGDSVLGGEIRDGKVTCIKTENLEDIEITADNYVLATGSYFGHGLIAGRDNVYEPVFGLDVDFDEDRNSWYDKNFFNGQNYLGFGVKTDTEFKPMKDGAVVSNLYAAGSVLGGFNPLHGGCGSGVAVMTALSICESILSDKN